jgi:hypothetical protein
LEQKETLQSINVQFPKIALLKLIPTNLSFIFNSGMRVMDNARVIITVCFVLHICLFHKQKVYRMTKPLFDIAMRIEQSKQSNSLSQKILKKSAKIRYPLETEIRANFNRSLLDTYNQRRIGKSFGAGHGKRLDEEKNSKIVV